MKKGFTIIEVALVLAIGGLIFLMVFVALPGLRTQQRDTSRREAIISLIDNVKKYQTNNRGALPGGSDMLPVTVTRANSANAAATTWAGFYREYLDNKTDPNGEDYKIRVLQCAQSRVNEDCAAADLQNLSEASFPNNYTIYVVTQATCMGEKAVATANPRKIAVIYKLEGAGIYCNNS